jgi:hypothetical protein
MALFNSTPSVIPILFTIKFFICQYYSKEIKNEAAHHKKALRKSVMA